MPKCNSCGKFYDNPGVMELVRNKANRWVSICRHCLNMGVDIDTVTQGTAVETSALAAADTPAIDVTLSGDSLANAKKLLEALRNLRHGKERVGRARTNERKKIDLTVHFTLARDDTRHEGVIRDFSQGGLRVETSYPLAKGQTVQFDWNTPLPPAMARILQSTAEVRRVVKNEDGMYDAGFKFMARQADKGANRRRFRRYRCDMAAYYQRGGSQLMSRATVTDISQGGCQMQIDEELAKDEVFDVRLIGGGGQRGDLVGRMRVCRAVLKKAVFETGCAFETMRMEPGAV